MNEVAYISIGSNLNNPRHQVKSAIEKFKSAKNMTIEGISSWYRSLPMGPKNQPSYINGVIKISTKLSPKELLVTLQKIENTHGRVRTQRWGPRSLDLDILLYGSLTINVDNLIIPHPGLKIRNFVLLPLADIAPRLVLPDGSSLDSLLENCSLKGIVPILLGDMSEKNS